MPTYAATWHPEKAKRSVLQFQYAVCLNLERSFRSVPADPLKITAMGNQKWFTDGNHSS
jgi:hypothetical protein